MLSTGDFHSLPVLAVGPKSSGTQLTSSIVELHQDWERVPSPSGVPIVRDGFEVQVVDLDARADALAGGSL